MNTTKVTTSKFEITDNLDSEEMRITYLNAALEENDPQLVLDALDVLSKAQGIKEIAKKTGLSRESLYKTMQNGKRPSI